MIPHKDQYGACVVSAPDYTNIGRIVLLTWINFNTNRVYATSFSNTVIVFVIIYRQEWIVWKYVHWLVKLGHMRKRLEEAVIVQWQDCLLQMSLLIYN